MSEASFSFQELRDAREALAAILEVPPPAMEEILGSCPPLVALEPEREYKRFLIECGGEGEIRTRGWIAPTPVFKTGALNHSATSP